MHVPCDFGFDIWFKENQINRKFIFALFSDSLNFFHHAPNDSLRLK